MLDLAIIAVLGFLTGDTDAAGVAVPKAVDAVPLASDPFPHFTAALSHCMAFSKTGDVSVFDDGAEVNTSGVAASVMYPAMAGMQFQIVASQQGDTRTCGGTGPGAPKITELDTAVSLPPLFQANKLVEVAFPPPGRVWANCGSGDNTFVMLVPGANDFAVLNVNGPDAVAATYCTVFGVK